MLKKVRNMLEELLGAEYAVRRYVLAVSGGLDSMVLVSLFRELFTIEHLVIAHFNHATRGKASDRDEAFVVQQAERFGIPCKVGRRAKSNKKSEEALRVDRKTFLEEVRKLSKSDFIVTAHHANDQLETFLMRLVRGTGMDGLKGIDAKNGYFVRPLLEISRKTLEDEAKRRKIEYVEDESNLSPIYFRNRVRTTLVPSLLEAAREFGGDEPFFSRFSGLISEVRQISEKNRNEDLAMHMVETPFWIRVDAADYVGLADPQRLRFLRLLMKKLGALVPDRRRVENWDDSIIRKNEGSKRLEIEGGVTAHHSLGFLYFSRPEDVKAPKLLKIGDSSWKSDSLQLCVQVSPSLAKNAEIRFFQPGDILGQTKLKKLFLDRRIPAPERSLIPLLAKRKSNEVLWLFPDKMEGVIVEQSSFPFSFSSALRINP